ncbi:MAG TPA: ABC transporter ATP-binding protein [Spirochaetota bacterium]|nr:ABC transporter ATP-binding protein [Spirochaetota bacterium]HOL57855.1 ABC transporter ATP-binding protein [Spirochaetota bacterium]HPP05362.1 ABC transporter ATP-binding protein [Spirochaetota bacterium]
MNSIIEFKNVSFKYEDEEDIEIENEFIFNDVTISLEAGITSLIGQNGTGKSTFLLLAGGILLPQKGDIFILGNNTKDLRDEFTRQKYVSFIYQNMEFETEEPIEVLLNYVYENGFHTEKRSDFISELIEIFELKNILKRKTQEISKGELQRTILAFSLLYGSKILMMDEPVFALENYQKHRVMKYITEYAKKNNISIFYSAHELNITERYSENILMFYKNRNIQYGKTKDLYNETNLEKLYEIPYSYIRQNFYFTELDKVAKK